MARSPWKKPLRYVHSFRDRHGKQRHVFRRAGFKGGPLPGEFMGPEFMAAYQQYMAEGQVSKIAIGARRTIAGSIDDAVVRYYASTAYASLKEGTRKYRRTMLQAFREDTCGTSTPNGRRSIKTLSTSWLDSYIATKAPHARRNWLKALRHFLQWAAKVEKIITVDPTKDLDISAPKSDGIWSWTDTEIEKYDARHPIGSQARLAKDLALESCQRKGDLVRFGWQHLFVSKGETFLDTRQNKTSTRLGVPVSAALSASLAAVPRTNLTFLMTSAGAPFTAGGLGNRFKEWCRDAGLPERCSIHGLRKARCRQLAEAGATASEIMAVSGHKSLSEAQKYVDAADQKKLASAGMRKIENEKATQNG